MYYKMCGNSITPVLIRYLAVHDWPLRRQGWSMVTEWRPSELVSLHLEEDDDVDDVEDFRWPRPWPRPRQPLKRIERFPLEEVVLGEVLETKKKEVELLE